MKSKNIFILLVIVILVVIIYSMVGSSGDEGYTAQIEKERTEKDHFMRTAAGSPFAKQPEEFKGLNYYPINADYRINASLSPIEKKSVVVLGTSDGKEDSYLTYAYAEFDFQSIHNKLLILEIMEQGPNRGTLFLAFGDATSGGETYGAGRYLDLKKVPGAMSITLDFNKAYNPYCAYNEEFSCPLPPRENLLSVPIEAGEKNYNGH